jgi:hypothetical protein
VWTLKSECFLVSFRPLPQIHYTNITYLMWSRRLILISQLHTKIDVVHFSNETRKVSLMFFNHKLATDTKNTRSLESSTNHDWTCSKHNTIQNKVKVTLQQATKDSKGGRSIALLILDLGARRGWVVSTTPRSLYPRERPGTHCTIRNKVKVKEWMSIDCKSGAWKSTES